MPCGFRKGRFLPGARPAVLGAAGLGSLQMAPCWGSLGSPQDASFLVFSWGKGGGIEQV